MQETNEINTADTEIPEVPAPSWRCNTYCRKVRHIYCEGRQYRNEDAAEQCPYFDEMLY